MKRSPKRSLRQELTSDLERQYFWWEAVGDLPRSHERIIAQAMNFAPFHDVLRLERKAGVDYLAGLMLEAEPGWLSDKSWEFWRGRLSLATGKVIPETPPRRLINDGAI
jgi:hypothetical protein